MSIYLDHAATSLPRRATAIAAAVAATGLASPGRGLHSAQLEALRVVDDARRAVRGLVGYGVVCFTSGATHSLNQAITGIRPRPRAVAIDPLAHNAVRRAANALKVPIWVLPHDGFGRVVPGRVEREWRDVDLVVLGHGSNVTGAIQPVADIVEIARARGARSVVDAAQTVGLASLEIGEPDLLAFSAHKGLAALPGTGVLVVGPNVDLDPILVGGTGFDSTDPEMPADLPARLEPGTPNLIGIAALGAAAADASQTRDTTEIAALLRECIERAGGSILGAKGRLPNDLPVCSFLMGSINPREMEEILDRSFGVITRAGLHCAPLAHELLGTAAMGAVRASAGPYTVDDDLHALGEALTAIHRVRPD